MTLVVNKEKLLEERVELIRQLNIDVKEGYNKAKYKASLPDINAKGGTLKIQFAPSSRVEGFISSALSKKREVLRMMNAHDIPQYIEEPSMEKPKKMSVTPRRQSVRIDSNDLIFGKPMSPPSKRELIFRDHRKMFEEILQVIFTFKLVF